MKLKDVWEARDYHTQKAGDILRYLGLAGIGIIWVFKLQGADKVSIPDGLVLPAYLIIIGLGLDLLQYVICSAIWGIFGRLKEKKQPHGDFEAPRQLNWPANVLFWAKVVSIVWAYILLMRFLGQILGTS